MLKGRKPPLVPERALEAARNARRNHERLDRSLTQVEMTMSILRDHPILIYSMGKVGTSALLDSVAAATESRVLKCHSLTGPGLADSTRRHHEIGETRRPRMQWQHQQLAHIISTARWKRWELVCGVREPIARSTSAYFHWLRRRKQLDPTVAQSDDVELHAERISDLVSRWIASDWFTDELLGTTGIDVYASPFPHESGYCVYEHGRFRSITIRQEDLATVGSQALGRFFDLPGPLPLTERNQASTSAQASLYHDFLNQYRFSAAVVDRALSAPQARHFYSDGERSDFFDRWTQGLPGSATKD